LTLLKGGEMLFSDMVSVINAACVEVLLETYIFDFERSAQAVAQALEAAAARGVQVRVVVDGVGTAHIPLVWQQRWQSAGVQWRVFNPVGRWWMLWPKHWRRLHRKLCVVDGEVAYCGGINLIDDHLEHHHPPLIHPRFDFAVRICGPLVADMHMTMTRLWHRLQAPHELALFELKKILATVRQQMNHLPVHDSDLLSTIFAPASEASYRCTQGIHQGIAAALMLRDNLQFRRQIEKTYRLAIAQAQREIIIANAYFIPGLGLQRALIHAAQRGVKITLLLQGRYEFFMQYHATRAIYGSLLSAGIRIFEYDASFLHAKVALMDSPHGELLTIGSSNLDPLSLLLAREANVLIRSDTVAKELRMHLQLAIEQQGRPVHAQAHKSRPWVQRLLGTLAYALMRLMILLTGHKY
jgi:cardiolipin synthase A/B